MSGYHASGICNTSTPFTITRHEEDGERDFKGTGDLRELLHRRIALPVMNDN